MPRLLDLILSSAAPRNVLLNAARGKLNIPPIEQLEILAYLASDPEFGEQARSALSSWDEPELAKICGRADVSPKIVEFVLRSNEHSRPVIRALLENVAVPESLLISFAADASESAIPLVLRAARVRGSLSLLTALSKNSRSATVRTEIEQAFGELNGSSEHVLEDSTDFEAEHAAEIASEQGRPFELTLGSPDEKDEVAELLPLVKGAVEASVIDEKLIKPEHQQQLSTLQKIASLTVGERVQLAMRGSREERMILIRDGVKVVALAVLESPKVNETEMELFAAMKNVQEVVLRGIATRRRYMKNYGVVRTLVTNPRTPLDVALPLVKTLLLVDLKNLMRNKSVAELIRRLATKSFLEKSRTHNK